jgi:hypothetical protein
MSRIAEGFAPRADMHVVAVDKRSVDVEENGFDGHGVLVRRLLS